MIEYIEFVSKFISLLPLDDIRKMFSMEKIETFDIWGNYNAFIKSLENPHSEICRIRNIYVNNRMQKQLNMNMYLIGKISRWRLIKRYWIITKTLWKYRTDLGFVSRTILLFVKLKKMSRWVFQLNLKEYWDNQESNNKLLEKIFTDKTIDELYLYKIKKEPE